MCRRSKLRIFRIVIDGLYEDLNALFICLPKSLGSRSLIHRIYGLVRAFAGLQFVCTSTCNGDSNLLSFCARISPRDKQGYSSSCYKNTRK